MKLAELQQQMHRMLRGEVEPDAIAGSIGADVARLTIYRDFVQTHIVDALEQNFVYTRAILGDEFAPLARDFFHSRAPSHWELNSSGEGFADYLEQRRAAGHPVLQPFHVVLAQFEWEEWLAFAHEDEVPDPDDVAEPVLNPTMAVVQSPYPLIDFLTDHKDELSPALAVPALLPELQTILVFRHPIDLIANAVAADDELLLAMKIAASHIAIADAAAATNQPEAAIRAALDRAARCGVIVQPRGRPQ
jgi:hypothetical protein